MAHGRQEHDWALASALLAMAANCHCDRKGHAYSPDEFNPFREDSPSPNEVEVTPENIEEFRAEFRDLR